MLGGAERLGLTPSPRKAEGHFPVLWALYEEAVMQAWLVRLVRLFGTPSVYVGFGGRFIRA
jgi:hypothetical protein